MGLGSVPAWLRPFEALSNGERFRATLARLVLESPDRAVLDEFSGVLDRQVAKVGSLAFAKAWRRNPAGQAVLLTPHRDVLDWLSPCWTFDTSTGEIAGRWLRRRPSIPLDLFQTDWRYWPLFEPHHYLKLPRMVAAKCYVGAVGGEPVAHLAVGTKNVGKGGLEARACRLVVMPEWQGAGVGMKFLNQICEWQLRGDDRARMPGERLTTLFHTSHPGLCALLRRGRGWRQVSCNLYGGNKARSRASISRARPFGLRSATLGYGGHFRAAQGFRYVGLEASP